MPATSTLHLTDADVVTLATWPETVAAIHAAYVAPEFAGAIPPRTMARHEGGWLRTLAGAPPGSRYMGAKLIAASMTARRANYLIPLFDRETADLVALIDGKHITAIRTAATSAVAADLLAPDRPLRIAVIGSGLEARNHVLALAAVRELAMVTVFSPTEANRRRLADDVGAEFGVPASAVASAERAVRGADLVIAAARSRDESPTVCGEWLEPGTTVISIGSTLPEQHEVDVDVIGRSDVIVADVPEEVAHETGDMLDAAAAGVEFGSRLCSLHDLVAGTVVGRTAAEQIVLYKSVGSALQDLAVAEVCLTRALETGLGTRLPGTVVPVAK